MKKFSRRNFIKATIGGLVIASGNIFLGCKDENISSTLTNDLEIYHLRQIITKDSSTSRKIMFQSDDQLKNPIVELREQNSDQIEKFNCVDCSFTDDDNENIQFVAEISNLTINKIYEYRIVDGDHCTNWITFENSDQNSFKALIFPDSQCADYDVWIKLAKDAYNRNEDTNFFVNMGDLVDNGEDSSQWRRWFSATEDFISKIPFVPLVGNHEYYNRQWQVRPANAYFNYFDVPNNNSAKFNRHYYSFDFGNAHFVVLDNQNSELDTINLEDGEEIISEQKNFLKQDMTATNKKWKIVLAHKDVLQYRINGRPERQEGFSDFGLEFMPLFDELKIDLVLTAHLHTYRDRGKIFNFERNDQGTLYILTGIAGDVRYPGLWIDHALDIVKAPQPEVDNYLTLNVTNDKIVVKCFNYDGTEIDNIEIS
ncbi:MAG: metallophosphoesterase family protein [Selenomonadaceae bacterium]|nr:metallophosphoesterase family protein [Selenomonadaceae bacterium]